MTLRWIAFVAARFHPHWSFIQTLKVFNKALIYERPTMEKHGCRRKSSRRGWERMVWEMVGVWKAIYREGWVKTGWEAINAVKKRGKTRFFDLTTDKNVWCRPPAMTDVFQNMFSGFMR
jgi:hypothetical protein